MLDVFVAQKLQNNGTRCAWHTSGVLRDVLATSELQTAPRRFAARLQGENPPFVADGILGPRRCSRLLQKHRLVPPVRRMPTAQCPKKHVTCGL
jgi:hypothetical protein